MEYITIDFLRGTVQADLPGPCDVGPQDVKAVRASLCALLSLKTAPDVLTIDFAGEAVSCDGLWEERPGLAGLEMEVILLVWHRMLGTTNVVRLLDALARGEIGWEDFQHLMLLEGTDWAPNAFVSDCLEHAHRKDHGGAE